MPQIREIPGGKCFDLHEEGEFVAYSYELVSDNCACFHGTYRKYYQDGHVEEYETSLLVLFAEDVSDDNVLTAAWDEPILELEPNQQPNRIIDC